VSFAKLAHWEELLIVWLIQEVMHLNISRSAQTVAPDGLQTKASYKSEELKYLIYR
jgi:hypothetical protein